MGEKLSPQERRKAWLYAALIVLVLLACAALALHTGRRDHQAPSLPPAKEALLDAAGDVVRLSLPFMTFGLWSGALWADAAWGGYWAWDIKEAWSLLTWCIYLIYLHVERFPAFASWRRPLLLLGFAAVVVTFLVVNLLPRIESMHSYAQ